MRSLLAVIVCGVATLASFDGRAAEQPAKIFKCVFDSNFEFFIAANPDATSGKIGERVGYGNPVSGGFDVLTGAYVFVEYADGGKLPITLTTIDRNGDAVHSRHSITSPGEILASQMKGKCTLSR